MSDLKGKIREIFAQPQVVSLATMTKEGKPWVRYVTARADDDLTLRVSTFLNSRKAQHIRRNPEVHVVCGAATVESTKHYLQIQGRAEVRTDEAERKASWSDGLKEYFKGPDDPNYAILIIKPYRIEYQSMTEMKPEIWEA